MDAKMDATKKLFKFAAEWEELANAARTEVDRTAWHGLARRWRDCAKTDRSHSVALHASLEQRRRQPRLRASRDKNAASSVSSNANSAADPPSKPWSATWRPTDTEGPANI